MPRKPRVEYEGAIYHVMARGNGGENIVKNEHDREWFVETLGEAVVRAGWCLHAYVLMRNHYHLLIETPTANLVEGIDA